MKRIWLQKDKKAYQAWRELMEKAELQTTEALDYTVGIYDDTALIASGSLSGKTIKCVAVCKKYQSENLLTQLVVHLLEKLREENQLHSFLYTKPKNEQIFQSLGFQKVVANQEVLFMEQGKPDFADYLGYLTQHKKAGPAHLPNVTVLSTEDYLVSSATFPTYFLKEKAPLEVAAIQATLDATLFKERIAPILEIQQRYVGEEPYSEVTAVYNQAMQQVFGQTITLTIVPRLASDGELISATKVRKAMAEGDKETLKKFLPATSYQYLVEHKKLMR
ncbi:GNAT family N-acetyltransferase [Enterococcus faecalis]|uniref:GNAT family N-acetyltransferase n=1 Tax=Enterococcus faecalis TaxID=1351 RepID=UPI00155EC24D|nr:GNAT family N-acetyltransferase [Enterococcus faecalis]NRC83652.1 GNAT family N-acetyltransferase [Enterococcus faecalis]NSR12075.1 GNAT family N-acetyltransferase [Enterococcus faecalis]NSS13028.1 GNAT family N-acetyltransferase [Enterococcus faecalis]NSS88797.1 GNAT family N-acetyltransferase [Enterococcus faecalis]